VRGLGARPPRHVSIPGVRGVSTRWTMFVVGASRTVGVLYAYRHGILLELKPSISKSMGGRSNRPLRKFNTANNLHLRRGIRVSH
jgi:hypothetical protein